MEILQVVVLWVEEEEEEHLAWGVEEGGVVEVDLDLGALVVEVEGLEIQIFKISQPTLFLLINVGLSLEKVSSSFFVT